MAAEAKRTAGGDCLLPLEMWREILIRVPVKSILRCRSVCKSWYSLISCPNFISDYSVRNLNKNGNRFLLQSYDSSGIGLPFSSHAESFMEFREHYEVSEAFVGGDVEIVGSCNGLISLCLRRHDGRVKVTTLTFLIWNPTIRKVVELPSRSFCSADQHFYYHGFGFDFKTGDYKVVFMRSVYLGRKNCDCPDMDANVCEMFDLSKGVWRGISPLTHSWYVCGRSECYLNGAVHWTGCRQVGGSVRIQILLSFGMSDEIFREIRMPDWHVDDNDISFTGTRSVTFGGLVHVIVWKRQNDYVMIMHKECSVWAMKEYGVAESWTKLFNIDLLSAEVYKGIEPEKFHLWENGEVLMVQDISEDEYDYDDEEYAEDIANGDYYDWGYRQELLLYNIEGRTCKQLPAYTKHIAEVCLYEESLALM